MTAAVQNRMVKTAFECFIVFAQNASRILKSFSPFFHLFAHTMGNVLRFIDDLIYCLFCAIDRVVNLPFRFVFHVAHGLSPSAIFNSGGHFFAGNADCPRLSFSARVFSPSPTRRAAFRIWLRVLPPASGTNSSVAVTPIAKPAAKGVKRSSFRRFIGSFVL